MSVRRARDGSPENRGNPTSPRVKQTAPPRTRVVVPVEIPMNALPYRGIRDGDCCNRLDGRGSTRSRPAFALRLADKLAAAHRPWLPAFPHSRRILRPIGLAVPFRIPL